MIRLDGNSLAAFRGAGVAGTVQSVAGCELFGAARMPSWASPYSAAATAALKAQFPTQWPTIRDYGFSHPEIVGYMNAYAPEDAKIAYSFVEGIGVRGLVGNGSSYIDTGFKPTSGTPFEITYHSIFIKYGSRQIEGWNASHWWGINGNLQSFGNNGSGVAWTLNTINEVKIGYSGSGGTQLKLNGTSAGSPGIAMNNFHAFHINGWNNECMRDTRLDITIVLNGVKVREMYPFIRKINGVDTCGMIDVLSGTFYQNAGSGSFTISESPA